MNKTKKRIQQPVSCKPYGSRHRRQSWRRRGSCSSPSSWPSSAAAAPCGCPRWPAGCGAAARGPCGSPAAPCPARPAAGGPRPVGRGRRWERRRGSAPGCTPRWPPRLGGGRRGSCTCPATCGASRARCWAPGSRLSRSPALGVQSRRKEEKEKKNEAKERRKRTKEKEWKKKGNGKREEKKQTCNASSNLPCLVFSSAEFCAFSSLFNLCREVSKMIHLFLEKDSSWDIPWIRPCFESVQGHT